MYMLDKRIEWNEANLNIDDLEKPMLFPDQTQSQPLQDINNKQKMYDEKDYNEEDCQEGFDCLPLTYIALLTKICNQNVNVKSEQCPEENISHLGLTKSEIGEETTQPESLPLCHDSFQIIKEEWHPENILETTH